MLESYANATLQKDSSGQDQFITSEYFQSDAIAYDELGRMSRVSDTHPETAGTAIKTHDVRYEYDAVGNRRAVPALYWDPVSQANGHLSAASVPDGDQGRRSLMPMVCCSFKPQKP